MMNKQDFHIGTEFFTEAGRWRCTDIGTRAIVAIKVDEVHSDNTTWHTGPPYAVEEHVFDENDLQACFLIPFQLQNMQVIALDLEGTLIQDILEPKPRPGLYEFLSFCKGCFKRVVMMTTVPEQKFRRIALSLVQHGYAPEWLLEIEYIAWERPYKDLSNIEKVNPEQVIIVDDYEGYIHPDQKSQWLKIESFFEQENDTEFHRLIDLLKE
jgi:NLI interacting factor-like phosphatase